MESFIDHAKDLKCNPKGYGEPFKSFEHGVTQDRISFQKVTLVAMWIIDWTVAIVDAGGEDRNYCNRSHKRTQWFKVSGGWPWE